MKKVEKRIKELDKEFSEILDVRTKGLFKLEFDSADSVNHLRKILKNKIPWAGGEALSLVSLTDKVSNQDITKNTVEVDEEGKTESTKVDIYSIELDALHVQNLNYFLNKYGTEGANSAKSFIKCIVPVINASNKLNELDTQLREIQGRIDKLNVEGKEVDVTEDIKVDVTEDMEKN
jgi:hypothetical protein